LADSPGRILSRWLRALLENTLHHARADAQRPADLENTHALSVLRHACGFALANNGHDTRALQAYLGHRNIQHTVRYTELSPTRFKDFWRQ
jgi:site-specific recombinase XerD